MKGKTIKDVVRVDSNTTILLFEDTTDFIVISGNISNAISLDSIIKESNVEIEQVRLDSVRPDLIRKHKN